MKYLTRVHTLRRALFFLALINYTRAPSSAQKNVTKRFYVDIDALPEQFSNDKLPVELKNADRCYNLIGCFEKIPITTLPQDPDSLKTEFRLYSNDSANETLVSYGRVENCLRDTDNCDAYPYDMNNIIDAPFKMSRRTIIIISGYMSKSPNSWGRKVRDLWLKLEDVNVIIVGWTGGNTGIYQTAAVNTRSVARQLTVLLYYMATIKGLNLKDESFLSNIYIIGHSLGAHIAGFVGQDLGGKLGRITGLEPAGPQFDSMDSRFRLDKTDAQLVDILHTNAGASIITESLYGSNLDSGHIDLYANDGRHQPGCGSDRLGCSHKKAAGFYSAYLKHELGLRSYLEHYKPIYRLYAYASSSYQEFHNGSTFGQRCPMTSLDDDNLNSTDLYRCSVPIDYTSQLTTLKDELTNKHGISFKPNETNQKYFFYTNEINDDQSDHYLLKIRINKKLAGQNQDGCNIMFDVEMTNGLDNKYKIQNYKLLDDGDELEIVVPFLSPNTITKYEIAKLDSSDYYMENDVVLNSTLLETSLARILPSSIGIKGVQKNVKEKTKKRGGIMNFVKRMFNIANGNEEEIQGNCDLSVNSFTVQPLRKFHRHLLAVYSSGSKAIDGPKIMIVKEGQKVPIDGFKSESTSSDKSNQLRLYLDSILIGPRDSSIDPPNQIVSEKSVQSSPADYPGLSSRTWLILILSVAIVIMIMALVSALLTSPADEIDKQPIMTDIQMQP